MRRNSLTFACDDGPQRGPDRVQDIERRVGVDPTGWLGTTPAWNRQGPEIGPRREEVVTGEVGETALANGREEGPRRREAWRRIAGDLERSGRSATKPGAPDALLDVRLIEAVFGNDALEQTVARRVNVVARVLWLRHVLQQMDDLAQTPKHQRRLPLALLGCCLDERAQLVEPSVDQRELILGCAGPAPQLPERPLRRRQAGERAQTHAAIGIRDRRSDAGHDRSPTAGCVAKHSRRARGSCCSRPRGSRLRRASRAGYRRSSHRRAARAR